jgi:hypothetical protein
MPQYTPTVLPSPKPDWMRKLNYGYYGPGSSNPISFAYLPPDGSTSEIRMQWKPTDPSDVFYTPEGMTLMQWLSDNDDIVFEGIYEHKKVIRSSKPGPVPTSNVWVRIWDVNGCYFDGPAFKVGS